MGYSNKHKTTWGDRINTKVARATAQAAQLQYSTLQYPAVQQGKVRVQYHSNSTKSKVAGVAATRQSGRDTATEQNGKGTNAAKRLHYTTVPYSTVQSDATSQDTVVQESTPFLRPRQNLTRRA